LTLVVSNTGPLLHLGEADALILLSWTGEISIPKAVDREMTRQNPLWQSQRPTWIHVQELTASYKVEAEAWRQAGLLESGEAEAVSLARQLKAHWLLTDDAAARLFAQTLGIEVHGSVGIVLWAAATRRLTRADAEAALDHLAQSSLWISPKVLAEAKAALNQLFP
jgi:predicted nucleic acid-binding protein